MTSNEVLGASGMSFDKVTLADYAKVQGGFAYKSSDFLEFSRNKVLKIKNLRFGTIDYSEPGYVSDQIAQETIRWKVKEGDVLISMTGSGPNAPQSLVGRVARVWRGEPDAWFNQRVGRICLHDEKAIHPDFIFYWLSLPQSQDYLVSNSSGSANQANISGKTIESLPIPKVDYEVSARIANLAKGFDEKLILNNKINLSFEQIVQAIFKSWFVDFEPVTAKIAALESGGGEEGALFAAMQAISGKDEAQLIHLKAQKPEQYVELRTIAELFPSAMQDSELGKIPEGWSVSQIGSEVVVVGGGTPSTKTPEFWDGGDIHWTSPRDLSNLANKILIDTERKITKAGLAKISSGLLPVNTVLMSSRAPVGYLAIAKIPVAINQGYIGMQCNKVLSPEFVIQWCSSNMDEIKSRATGTTFAEISKKNFNTIPVLVPRVDIVNIYTKQSKSIYEKIEILVRESSSLVSLRDALLPRLLSGSIVSEVVGA